MTHLTTPSDDLPGSALSGHLLRIDHLLTTAGVPRRERDATLQQIAEQFYDLLPSPAHDATHEQVDAALAALGPELAYRHEQPTVGQLLRTLSARLGGGTMVPLMLNDHGRKRVVWGELVKRLAFIWLMFVGMGLILAPILGESKPGATSMSMMGLMGLFMVLGILLHLRRTPVESLPRAEGWTNEVIGRHRWAWVAMFTCSGLIVLALYPVAYVVAAVATHRPVWPIHQPTFLAAMGMTGVLCFALVGIDALRRRHTRRRVERLAATRP